jgi:hypothetical protein
MPTLDDEIARHIAEALAAGELKAAKSYGKPMTEMEGWEQTPEELRMPFKVMKDAGVAPPEIELFHERAKLRQLLEAVSGEADRIKLQQALSELEQKIALRLEALRSNRSL